MKTLTQRFADWVATQSGEYVYTNSFDCPFACYLKSLGHPKPVVGGTEYAYSLGYMSETLPLPNKIASALCDTPHTYQELHRRLTAE